MLLKVSRKINGGEVEFTIDERDEDKALEMMTFLSVENYCNNCNERDSIVWQSNRASNEKGEFLYTKRRCLKCSATSGVGKYKTGGMFWKRFEVYEAEGGSPAKNATGDTSVAQVANKKPDQDDIPF